MDKPLSHVLLIEDNPGDARLVREMLLESKKVLFNLQNALSLKEGFSLLELAVTASIAVTSLETMFSAVRFSSMFCVLSF